jgi:hypothetical protein
VSYVDLDDTDDYTVGDDDYMIFANWATGGTTGTATITLPRADDSQVGRMIRVKTGSTISNSYAINVRVDPADAGTVFIDGNGEQAMDREYDGITVMLVNSPTTGFEWLVIQRKSK